MNIASLFDVKAEAQEIVRQVGRFEIPDDAPEDLKDRRPLYLLSKDGRRCWTKILPDDVLHGGTPPAVSLLMLCVFSFLSAAAPGGYGALFALVPLIVWVGTRRKARTAAVSAALREASNLSYVIQPMLAARTAQAKRAKPVDVILGHSSGQLSDRSDVLGADPGQTMGLSVEDLSTHLFVFGPTGCGKTSGLLRPILTQWNRSKKGGALVMDGKGDLPLECSPLPGFKLLAPDLEGCQVALLGGLSPSVVVSTLAPPDDAEFWTAAGKSFLYNLLVVIQASGRPYTVVQAARAAQSVDERKAMLKILEQFDLSDVAADAAAALSAHDKMPEKTRGGIEATVLSWLRPIISDPYLFAWANASPGEGEDVTACMRGASVGVLVPEYRFGAAAAAVSRLIAAQVYLYAKNRGSHWPEGDTSSLMMVDEAALMLGANELEILPVARSLGLYFVCAAQNKSQVEDTFDQAGAEALLDNFRSLIVFGGANESTMELAMTRAGNSVSLTSASEQAAVPNALVRVEAGGGGTPLAARFSIIGAGVRNFISLASTTSVIGMGSLHVLQAIPEGLALSPGECLALLNRGGVLRRDTMRTQPIFWKKPDLQRRALPPLATPKPAEPEKPSEAPTKEETFDLDGFLFADGAGVAEGKGAEPCSS